MKEFYDKDQIENKEQFKSYSMELIRYVMNDSIANNEAKWLREYAPVSYTHLDVYKRQDLYLS